MSRLHAIELHLLLIVSTIAIGTFGWQVWFRGEQAKQVLADAHQGLPDVFAESRDVTIAVIGKCKPGKPETCGLVPAVRNMAQDSGAAVRTMQRQVAQTEPLVEGAATALKSTAGHLDKAADALTGMAQQGTTDLATVNDSITKINPLILATTGTIKSINSVVSDQKIVQTAANVEQMTSDGARITKDAADEADKLAHPPKKKLGFWGGFWVGMQYVHKMMPSIF